MHTESGVWGVLPSHEPKLTILGVQTGVLKFCQARFGVLGLPSAYCLYCSVALLFQIRCSCVVALVMFGPIVVSAELRS